MVRRACLQFVIMVFPDHTHLLFFYRLVLVSSSEDYSEEYVSEETTSSFFEFLECHSLINQSDT